MWPGARLEGSREGSLRKPAALHECEEVEWICKSPNSTCASEEGVIMEGLRFREGEFK